MRCAPCSARVERRQNQALNHILIKWMKARVELLSAYCNDIASIFDEDAAMVRFKSSADKKVARYRFTPTNLHVQRMLVAPVKEVVCVGGHTFPNLAKPVPLVSVCTTVQSAWASRARY
jgi:hypothetical protein